MNKRLTIFLFSLTLSAIVYGTAIDSLKQELFAAPNDTERISLLNHIGMAYSELENDSALLFLNEAQELSRQLGVKKYEAITQQNFGCFYIGRSFDTAKTYHEEALLKFIELGDSLHMAEQYAYLAMAYQGTSQFEKALPNHYKAAEIYDKLGKVAKAVTVRSNLGDIYMRLGDMDNALKVLYDVLEYEPRSEVEQHIPSVLVNVGYYNFLMGKPDEALRQFQLSRNAASKIGSTQEVAIGVAFSGKMLTELERFDEAIDTLMRAKAMFEDLGDRMFLNKVHINLMELYNAIGQPAKAVLYAERAIETSREIDVLWMENLAQFQLALAQAELGNYKEAYHAMHKHKCVNDQVHGEIQAKNIADIHLKYETEQKEKENVLLRKDIEMQQKTRNLLIALLIFGAALILLLLNRFLIKRKAHQVILKQQQQLEDAYEKLMDRNEEIQTQAEILEEANATKDKFFSIIAHDLKSPFNSILGLSELMLRNLNEMNAEKLETYVKAINSASNTTYNLLSNLLVWARSQSNRIQINKEELNLSELIEDSIQPYLENAEAKKLSVRTDIANEHIVSADKYTLTTVFGNLFSNAIKFTETGGTIKLDVDKQPGHIAVNVKDNGVGMSDDVVQKLFRISENYSSVGTNEEQGTGLGLILCKEFVEKNNGDIQVSSKVGAGTTFTVRIPLN